MTDEKIIKALEEWSERGMTFCNMGMPEFARNILDLINRQRAEIEKYKKYYETMDAELDSFRKDQAEVKFLKNRIRAEAIKEFAGRLISMCDKPHWCVWMSEIEDLVEEMTGDQK